MNDPAFFSKEEKELVSYLWDIMRPDLGETPAKFMVDTFKGLVVFCVLMGKEEKPVLLPMEWDTAVFVAMSLRTNAIAALKEKEGVTREAAASIMVEYEGSLIDRMIIESERKGGDK